MEAYALKRVTQGLCNGPRISGQTDDSSAVFGLENNEWLVQPDPVVTAEAPGSSVPSDPAL